MINRKNNDSFRRSSSSSSPGDKIPGTRVQLIDAEGVNQGVVNKSEALEQAEFSGFDLVMLAEKGPEGVPLVKILDLGKSLYEKKKKATEAKKKQKVIKIKELKLRPSIGDHDLQIKVKQAIEFFNEGKRVKVTLMFRGREVTSRNEVGPELFQKFEKMLSDAGIENLSFENESKIGKVWSKVYFTK